MRTGNAPGGRWGVVIPFYNEEEFIAPTLASIVSQTLAPDRIILVDNGSTDGSCAAITSFMRDNPHAAIEILDEPTPGKASALKRGLAAIDTEFVATCDADTIYPRTYLAAAEALFAKGGEETAAVLAFSVCDEASLTSRITRLKGVLAARLMPSQAHSGGYGQSFRTLSLKAVGGFDPAIWPFCLMDHEVIHRIGKKGGIKYSFGHWCAPSPRRGNRRRVRWTLGERLLYHVTPRGRRDWLFYSFLRRRFEARRVSELNLREKPWSVAQAARRVSASRSNAA